MKLAVFQVCERGGAARLICLEMPSLQSAANLEHWLTMNADAATEISLLGRFDSVSVAINEEEAESFVFVGGGQARAAGARMTKLSGGVLVRSSGQ